MHRAAAALLLFVISATTIYGQTPSPTEQRRWAVETTRWLEQNPLHADAKKRAAELLRWWTEVPDLTLNVCSVVSETKNKKVSPTVVSQALFSAGAHIIEHPDSTLTDQSLAGVEGALRAYSNALATDPKMRDKFLDGLLTLQSEGKLLESHVNGAVAKCEAAKRNKG
jgi:hypothetical protein